MLGTNINTMCENRTELQLTTNVHLTHRQSSLISNGVPIPT